MVMKVKLFIGILVINAVNVFGGTLLWDTFSYGLHSDETGLYPEHNSNLSGVVLPLGDSSVSLAIALNTTLSLGNAYATLTAVTSTYYLGYPNAWRVFTYGDVVDYNAIYNGHNDYFYRLADIAYQDRNLTIANGDTAYLGFSMGGGIYGWVQLGFDGTSVYVVNSAVDIDGDPIQVGLIPEPATSGLLLAGCVALFLRRRRQRLRV
jgi:hypothetical protein